MTASTGHLYVHLPFCAHRCGYCDFVTVVGRAGQHAVYVDALIHELEAELPQECFDIGVVLVVAADDGDEVAVAAAGRAEREVDVEVPRGHRSGAAATSSPSR